MKSLMLAHAFAKTAAKAGLVQRLLRGIASVPARGAEKALLSPAAVALGKKGKGQFGKARFRPRKGSPLVPISRLKALELKADKYPVVKVKGKWYRPKRRFGGVAGMVQKHPTLAGGAAALYALQPQGMPSETAYRHLRQQVAPMAPQVPPGYEL